MVPYDVPTKPDAQPMVLRYAIPWCSPFRPIIDEMRKNVISMSPQDDNLSSPVRAKYENTLAFLDFMYSLGRDAPA